MVGGTRSKLGNSAAMHAEVAAAALRQAVAVIPVISLKFVQKWLSLENPHA